MKMLCSQLLGILDGRMMFQHFVSVVIECMSSGSQIPSLKAEELEKLHLYKLKDQ